MQELINQQAGSTVNDERSLLPQCCGTGCTVCVLDYPEMFLTDAPDADMLAMLEAVERAQQQAGQIIAGTDGDSR